MLNGVKKDYKKYLKVAFESGFTNAASSLTKMVKDKIYFNNFHFGVHKLEPNFLKEYASFSRNKGNLLITTEIFGEVTGKSYLFLSDEEYDVLTSGIPESKNPTINLKEEFLKEVDNILSASVITRLSNELNLKMYGDIPILVGNVHGDIEDIIYDDFNEQTEDVYINSISFSFEKQPVINPFFIWVVNNDVLKALETKSVV